MLALPVLFYGYTSLWLCNKVYSIYRLENYQTFVEKSLPLFSWTKYKRDEKCFLSKTLPMHNRRCVLKDAPKWKTSCAFNGCAICLQNELYRP